MIKRRLQIAREVAPDAVAEDLRWDQTTVTTESIEPAPPDRHMPDFLLIDVMQNRGALNVTGAFKSRRHRGSNVETARFKHQRHDRESRQQVAGGCGGRFPQPVMRR